MNDGTVFYADKKQTSTVNCTILTKNKQTNKNKKQASKQMKTNQFYLLSTIFQVEQ